MVHTRSDFDASWHHHLAIGQNYEEYVRLRRKVRVYLARYMRESVFSWDSVEVVEMQDYFEELSELIKNENGPNRED
jgi:hypothetical protein